MRRAALDHLEDPVEDAGGGSERLVLALQEALPSVELAEELVRPIDEVHHHAGTLELPLEDRLLGVELPELGPVRRDLGEEAGALSRVAGDALLLDHDEDGVPVAVDGQADDALRVPRGGALHPELLPGAAPEAGHPFLQGAPERFAVHPGHHEDLAVPRVLDDRGDEPVRIVADAIEYGLDPRRRFSFPHLRPSLRCAAAQARASSRWTAPS